MAMIWLSYGFSEDVYMFNSVYGNLHNRTIRFFLYVGNVILSHSKSIQKCLSRMAEAEATMGK